MNERLNNLYHAEKSNKDLDADVRQERDQVRAYDMFATGMSVFKRGVYDKADDDAVEGETNFKLKSIRNLRKKDIMSTAMGKTGKREAGKVSLPMIARSKLSDPYTPVTGNTINKRGSEELKHCKILGAYWKVSSSSACSLLFLVFYC